MFSADAFRLIPWGARWTWLAGVIGATLTDTELIFLLLSLVVIRLQATFSLEIPEITRAREVAGSYENDVMTLTIGKDEAELRLEVRMRPEIRVAADKGLPPDHAPFDLGLLPGDEDEYVITGGAFRGQRGFFTRDESGAVVGVDLAGRLFNRVPTVSE